MALRDILIHPDPRLKTVTEPVSDPAELKALAEDMLETMYHAPGIGLAAPQVGVLKRMLVMDCVKDEDAESKPMVLINPEIKWSSEEKNVYEEGCLSIPEIYNDIERPAEVEVTWTSLLWSGRTTNRGGPAAGHRRLFRRTRAGCTHGKPGTSGAIGPDIPL